MQQPKANPGGSSRIIQSYNYIAYFAAVVLCKYFRPFYLDEYAMFITSCKYQ